MSKGSNRRKTQISQDEERLRWIISFTKNDLERLCAEKELEMYLDTGHVLLYPARQYCKYCGEAMFTSASAIPCTGIMTK